MDDTISRQAAIDMCRKPRMRNADCSDFEMEIMMLPSAQPIIRCKDCKWFNDIGCAIRIVDDTDKPSEEDYCSFAER